MEETAKRFLADFCGPEIRADDLADLLRAERRRVLRALRGLKPLGPISRRIAADRLEAELKSWEGTDRG